MSTEYRNPADRQLFRNFKRLSHTLHFKTNPKRGQRRFLRLLERNGKMTQKELVEATEIKAASASELLTKLEESGFICREKSTADKRVTEIRLTEAGQEEVQSIRREHALLEAELFSCLSENEKLALIELTSKLCEDWQRRFGECRPRSGE